MQTYTQEVSKLTSEIKKKDADRSDMTPAAVQRRRRERERLQSLVDQLNQDFKVQTSVYQSTKDRLLKERDFWFLGTTSIPTSESVSPRNRTVLAILQHCVIPRCLFGPNEAIYSAKFLREMHKLGTRNFSSLTLFDKVVFSYIFTNLASCLSIYMIQSFLHAQTEKRKTMDDFYEKYSASLLVGTEIDLSTRRRLSGLLLSAF